MKKKINSAYNEMDFLESLLAKDIRIVGDQISSMSQKKFRRGDNEMLKYYQALKKVSEFYGFKNGKI